MLQIATFQILHRDVKDTFVFAELVNRNDVLVVQISSGARLMAKTAQVAGVTSGGQHFDRYQAADRRVESEKNLAESPSSEFFADFVLADSLG
jgi:hypothetical protein